MPRLALSVRAVTRIVSIPLALGLVLSACGDDNAGEGTKQAVIRQYVAVVRRSYDDSIAEAKKLRTVIDELIQKPSMDTLAAAREAWITSRPAYLQTEAYRFYEGPIDDPEDGLEGRLNAWPLDEAFIDYARNPRTDAIERKGIINDRAKYPVITSEVLIAQSENGGAANMATGYHAIEFLLWGQDVSVMGPGNRPYTDFVGGSASPDPDSDRRRQYLIAVSDLLIEDLQATRDAWNDGDPYLNTFLANVGDKSLKDMITGIAFLAGEELAAKRIRPAYDSQDQEDEHSCFSDNTHNDLKYDLVGIQNVYFGRYEQDDGLGLEDLVKAKDPALDIRIKSAFADADAALSAIPVPFDQAIRGDAASLRKVRDAIDKLDALHDSLALLITALRL